MSYEERDAQTEQDFLEGLRRMGARLSPGYRPIRIPWPDQISYGESSKEDPQNLTP